MLMDEIRKYRAIYDKSCQGYKDQRVKKNAWQAVANTLRIDVASEWLKIAPICISYQFQYVGGL